MTGSAARGGWLAAGAAAVLLLSGCSVTVQPDHPAAAAAPSTAVATQPATTPATTAAATTPSPSPTDADHTVCQAVHTAFDTGKQKVAADKSSKRRMGTDYKNVASALRTQAQKTKDAELKTVLTQFATAYDQLGTDVAAGRGPDAGEKKLQELGPTLDGLCPLEAQPS